MDKLVKINRINFLRFLSYLEEGYSYDEVEEMYGSSGKLINMIYDTLNDCESEVLIEIIWFLVCESLYYAVYDIAEVLEIEEEEMYWL